MIKLRYIAGGAGAVLLLGIGTTAAAVAASPRHAAATQHGAVGHTQAAPPQSDASGGPYPGTGGPSDPTQPPDVPGPGMLPRGLHAGTGGLPNPKGPAQPPVITGSGKWPISGTPYVPLTHPKAAK